MNFRQLPDDISIATTLELSCCCTASKIISLSLCFNSHFQVDLVALWNANCRPGLIFSHDRTRKKKLFCHLQSLQIKTIFQEKNAYKLNFQKFTVAVYLWSWRHWCQLRWAASAGKTEKWNVFTTTTIIITTERNTVNHYDKIYGVFETLTNK